MANRMRFYLGRMLALDSALCVSVSHTSQYHLIRNWFRLISRLGDGLFWYTLMMAILVIQQNNGLQPVLHMAIVGLAGTLLYKWLKHKTHRPRPAQVHQDVWVTGKPLFCCMNNIAAIKMYQNSPSPRRLISRNQLRIR